MSKQSFTQFQGKTMGTQYHISVVSSTDTIINQEELKTAVDQILLEINRQMSTYLVDSEISKFNQNKNTAWFPVSKDLFHVVGAAQKISRETKGIFDITVYPLVNVWGFGPADTTRLPNNQNIQEAKKHIGYENFELRESPPALRKKNSALQMDLSALAKGFAVDKISQYLSNKGLKNYLVEIGGELRTSGYNKRGKKWRIAIQNPDSNVNTQKNSSLEISNQAMATSGDYRNYYVEKGQRFSHIIDPSTGSPVKNNLASVTVVNDSTMLADAYATALMVMGEEQAKLFSKAQNLSVFLIIRDHDKFRTWDFLSTK